MYVGFFFVAFHYIWDNATVNPSFSDPCLFFKRSTSDALMGRDEFCLPEFCFDSNTVTCWFNMATVMYAATQNLDF